MKRVTGIGGVFFKCQDPAMMRAWYSKHLGFEVDAEYGCATFSWRNEEGSERAGETHWGSFSADTEYFNPSTSNYMINYRVADLHALLATLRDEGVNVMDETEESEFGKFGWVMDPEGNKLELWEPPIKPPAEQKDGG